jgi:hypothetical protein
MYTDVWPKLVVAVNNKHCETDWGRKFVRNGQLHRRRITFGVFRLCGALNQHFNVPMSFSDYSSAPDPRVIRSKTYRGYVKPRIIPKAIYNVIFV